VVTEQIQEEEEASFPSMPRQHESPKSSIYQFWKGIPQQLQIEKLGKEPQSIEVALYTHQSAVHLKKKNNYTLAAAPPYNQGLVR